MIHLRLDYALFKVPIFVRVYILFAYEHLRVFVATPSWDIVTSVLVIKSLQHLIDQVG